jgi:hypothetical protein
MLMLLLNLQEPGDRLVLEYRQPAALDLRAFRDSLEALERLWERHNPGTRLAVARLAEGSVIAEFIPYVVGSGMAVYAAMDSAVTISDFVEKTARAIKAFAGIYPHQPTLTSPPAVAGDLLKLIDAMPKDEASSFAIRHTHSVNGQITETVVEARLGGDSLESAREALRAEVGRSEAVEAAGKEKTIETLSNVELYLDQVSRDPGKSSGRSRDKGVVPTISPRPQPLYFAPGRDLKDRILSATDNPLQTRYRVNIQVLRVGGRPQNYTVFDFKDALLLPPPGT